VWDVLALAAIVFVLWKVFVAPRDLSAANAHPAPHAAYERLDGGTFRVTSERGHVLFLDFYASWCEPCRLELPLVEAWAKDHPAAAVVPVDVGEPRAVVAEFARAHELRGVAFDPSQSSQAWFAVQGFPTVVVVDPQGRVRAKWEGLNPAIGAAMSNAAQALGAR